MWGVCLGDETFPGPLLDGWFFSTWGGVVMSIITDIFNRYKGSYAQGDGRGLEPMSMTPEQLQQTSRNEFRIDDYRIIVKKRGNNFYDRCVCWLEGRFFSRWAKPQVTLARQVTTNNFSVEIMEALAEMGVEDPENHPVIKRIEGRAARRVPLRSNFVREVLKEVAHIVQTHDMELWGEVAPMSAQESFRFEVTDDDPPLYDELEALPDDEGGEPPPDYGAVVSADDPPAYGENGTGRNNDDGHNQV